jgi:Mesyanzhinovviridae DNA polymerase
MKQPDLFNRTRSDVPRPDGWRPDAPPELNGEPRIILNAETTGLKWWAGDRPTGWSYYLPESGRFGYLPVRHQVGENLPLERVHDWMRQELPGKVIDNINTKFDGHHSREDGVDWVDDLRCELRDVQHMAALLDDNRFRFNLDQLSADLLNWDVEKDPIGKIPKGIRDESEFCKLPAWEVAPYAVRNVIQVHRLNEVLEPRILEESLTRVHRLESDLIPVVMDIERNGCYLDVELMNKWLRTIQSDLEEELYTIFRATGIRVNSPRSPKDAAKVFAYAGIHDYPRTETGLITLTDNYLKTVKSPTVAALRKAIQLQSIQSKLTKYSAAMRAGDGWIRHNLHQLRVGHDQDDKQGTKSGRFSAAGDKSLKPDGLGSGGYNPQQIVAVEKQTERGWNSEYVIRRLWLPGSPAARKENPSLRWMAADAMQIEYRLFAHYAKMHDTFWARPKQKMIGGKMVWISGPLADFHALVSELLLPVNPALNRKLVKNINFAMIYGAGLLKFAFMIGMISEQEYLRLREELYRAGRDWSRRKSILEGSEGVQEAGAVREAYLGMFPQVQPLLKLASETAEERGWVSTIYGRRARLVDGFHASLNRIIQGGAADINKLVLLAAYRERKRLGLTLRVTVHDEVGADIADPRLLPVVRRLLNTQQVDVRVKILWDTGIGRNWAEAKDYEPEENAA